MEADQAVLEGKEFSSRERDTLEVQRYFKLSAIYRRNNGGFIYNSPKGIPTFRAV